MDEDGHKFWIEDGEIVSRPATAEEIEAGRKMIAAKGAAVSLRSCWQCNSAHSRFLKDGEAFAFVCLVCGRWYAGGVDVMDYQYFGLPIRDEMLDCGPLLGKVQAMRSAWFPSPAEIAAINAGAPIHLVILGRSHPPVVLAVGEVPG